MVGEELGYCCRYSALSGKLLFPTNPGAVEIGRASDVPLGLPLWLSLSPWLLRSMRGDTQFVLSLAAAGLLALRYIRKLGVWFVVPYWLVYSVFGLVAFQLRQAESTYFTGTLLGANTVLTTLVVALVLMRVDEK